VLVSGGLLALLAGCGDGAKLISRDEEIRMGREAAADFERKNGGRDQDQRRNVLANSIGTRITAAANSGKYPKYPYEFRVLDNGKVNANAFPGGIIYLWRGLYNVLGYEEEQLAWVAGHEAAHVARQHSVQRVERALGYELIIQLALGKDTAGKIASAVAGLSLQEYGRDQELEADRLGATLAKEAGYDPTASLLVLAAFKKQGSDPSNLELLFASHPGNTTREENLNALFRQQGWSGKHFKP
jgi:predicted Zn-dependent protease